nr:MAG TPA: hypothetical protein [Caudoviricetes sp.]
MFYCFHIFSVSLTFFTLKLFKKNYFSFNHTYFIIYYNVFYVKSQ